MPYNRCRGAGLRMSRKYEESTQRLSDRSKRTSGRWGGTTRCCCLVRGSPASQPSWGTSGWSTPPASPSRRSRTLCRWLSCVHPVTSAGDSQQPGDHRLPHTLPDGAQEGRPVLQPSWSQYSNCPQGGKRLLALTKQLYQHLSSREEKEVKIVIRTSSMTALPGVSVCLWASAAQWQWRVSGHRKYTGELDWRWEEARQGPVVKADWKRRGLSGDCQVTVF